MVAWPPTTTLASPEVWRQRCEGIGGFDRFDVFPEAAPDEPYAPLGLALDDLVDEIGDEAVDGLGRPVPFLVVDSRSGHSEHGADGGEGRVDALVTALRDHGPHNAGRSFREAKTRQRWALPGRS